MHHAPSVQYPVGRSRIAVAVVVCLWSLGAFAAVGQAWQTGGLGGLVLLTGGSVLLAGAIACWYLRQTPVGALRWDGESWYWLPASPSPGACSVPLTTPPQVSLDLQLVLLLSLNAKGQRACWLWLEQSQLPDRWDDLRRALFSKRQGAPEIDSTSWPVKGPV